MTLSVKHSRRISNACAVALLSVLMIGTSIASETTALPVPSDQTGAGNQRWIIKRHSHGETTRQPLNRKHIQRVRSDDNGLEVYAGDIDSATLQQLRNDPDVEYVVADGWKRPHATPNDALYSDQWYLQDTQPGPSNTVTAAAIAANLAWDKTTGSNGVVIAVLDTGIRYDHPDLQPVAKGGRMLPGFDFVSGESTSSFLVANDGDGWDADPSDTGDGISQADLDRTDKFFEKCGGLSDSSWHGSRVTGLIGASSNNAIGIAGVTWNSYVLPVRVLGKCGGRDADIINAMRWAAGLHVSGVNDNPYPAKIINMSLGAPEATGCSPAYQDVINELKLLGTIVVVSAGNEGGPVDEPANCAGVLAVSGIRHVGTKVGYSSLGPEVSVAAPAGNCVNQNGECLYSLVTTTDTGKLAPVSSSYTDHFNNANLGTSFSAPLAAGVAALMQSVNNKLTPAQIIKRMQQGSRAFPATTVAACHVPIGAADIQLNECACTANTCGAGMLYAPDAITQAQRPIAYISAPTGGFASGSAISLNGSISSAACNRSIASYSWSVTSTTGATPIITNANQANVTINAPTSGSFTLRLTVTDDIGAMDTADIQVLSSSTTTTSTSPLSGASCPVAVNPTTPTTAPASPSTPASSGGSSGGGGNFGEWLLLALMTLVFVRVALMKSSKTAHCQ